MSEPSNQHDPNDLSERKNAASETDSESLVDDLIDQDAEQVSPDSELEQARQESAQLKEALLRLRAEMDNREKRLEREMIKARKFALESVMRDFIPVLDSFDQAIAQNEEGASEGLSLTYKQALKVLADHGLEVVEPTGQPFDPNWHEAIVAQPSDQHPPDTVLDVLQKGYRLNERLIRPARVVVAKATN